MLCSRCSSRVRPIVAIDIDGTLGDYYGHFWDFAREYLGIPVPDPTPIYDMSEPHREWFCRNYGVSIQVFRDIKLAFRAGSMKRSMPAYHDWIDIVHKISELGAEIWVTTTRPYLRMDNVDPDTRFWLERHGVSYDYLLYDEVKYQELGHRVERRRVVAVLDDVDEMYDDAEAIFGRQVPLLRRGAYNRAVVRPNVVNSAAEAYRLIRLRIEEYERING